MKLIQSQQYIHHNFAIAMSTVPYPVGICYGSEAVSNLSEEDPRLKVNMSIRSAENETTVLLS